MTDSADQTTTSRGHPERANGRVKSTSRGTWQGTADVTIDEDQRFIDIAVQQAALAAEYAALTKRKAEKNLVESLQDQILQESGLRKQVERDLATAQSDNKELLKAQEREREEASARLQQIDRQHSAANKALTQNLDEAREQLIRSQQTISVMEESTQQLSEQLTSAQKESQENLQLADQHRMNLDAALERMRAREATYLQQLDFLTNQAEYNRRTIDELSKQPRLPMEAAALPVNRRPHQNVYGPVGGTFSFQTRGYNSQVLPPAAVNSQHGMADAPHPQAGVPYQAADVPYPPAGAQYPPADTPNPPAGDQARAYQHNQAAALPASLSLQSSQEQAVPAQQSGTTSVEAADDTPRSLGAISVTPRYSQDGSEEAGASLPAPLDEQQHPVRQAVVTQDKPYAGVIDGQAFLAKLQKKDTASLPQDVAAAEQCSLGAVPAVHADPTPLPSCAPVQASRAEPLEPYGRSNTPASSEQHAGANATPQPPVYVPALPPGHFAALSEAAKQEYTDVVFAAQNANMQAFVSAKHPLPGQRYVTPLHPDDRSKQSSGAAGVGRPNPAAKGTQARTEGKEQPSSQQDSGKGEGAGGRRRGYGGKRSKNKNRKQKVAQSGM